jgi:hypothetical protein
VYYLFEHPFEGSEEQQPEDEYGDKQGICENIELSRNDGGEPNDEEINEKGIETDSKEHLGGQAVAIAALGFDFQIFQLVFHVLAICNPKCVFISKPFEQLLNQYLVVEVEVEFENVDYEDNVELVANCKDYRA